jgi:acyl-CoA thioester hydrolase
MDNTLNFSLIHKINIRVRYSETDKMGIVNNGVYLSYFEVGRTELMRHNGLPYLMFENNEYMLPVIEAHVKYEMPAYYDDLLEIEASLNPAIGAKVKFDYNIYKDNSTIAKGYTVHSFMNSISRRAVRPPKFFLDAIEEIRKNKEHQANSSILG